MTPIPYNPQVSWEPRGETLEARLCQAFGYHDVRMWNVVVDDAFVISHYACRRCGQPFVGDGEVRLLK